MLFWFLLDSPTDLLADLCMSRGAHMHIRWNRNRCTASQMLLNIDMLLRVTIWIGICSDVAGSVGKVRVQCCPLPSTLSILYNHPALVDHAITTLTPPYIAPTTCLYSLLLLLPLRCPPNKSTSRLTQSPTLLPLSARAHPRTHTNPHLFRTLDACS